MDQITSFIHRYLPFLLDNEVYDVTHAEESTVNGGDSLVEFASDSLHFRFFTDRGQLFLDLRPGTSRRENDWYSIDLIRRLFTGDREESGLMDPGYAEFIRTRLADVEKRVSPAEWPHTEKALKDIKHKRSEEMFG
ncbi:MAG: hypothetical protein PIR02_06260 [Microbacterium enclense]